MSARGRRVTQSRDGAIVNDSHSLTDPPSGLIDAISKFRNSIEVTRLISSNARLRPGQIRGPAPKGMEMRSRLVE